MSDQVVDLGYRPRPWQGRFHRTLKRWNIAVLHRRAGKTILALMTLIDLALRCDKELGRFGYLAPFLNQSKSIAWAKLKAIVSVIPGIIINEAELWVEFPHNKARIKLYGADNAEALRGGYFDFIVLDELKDIKTEVWVSIIRPALSDRNGGALFLGTPDGVNLLSEMYYKALKDPDWNVCLLTVYETNALPAEEIEAARRDMSEQTFAREFLCDFSAGAADQLISFETVMAASGRTLRTEQYNFAAKVIGVDVARQGDDRTVIMRRQGLASFKPLILAGADSMAVATAVANDAIQWNPDAILVDGTGGYGAGVIDRLRQLGFKVIEVQFGSKANDPRFMNKRTEMYWLMAEWLRDGGAIPDMTELKTELCAPTYTHKNAAGRMALESKENIKERLGLSPDVADALAITFAMPVQPKIVSVIPTKTEHQRDYDPFERWQA